jgi:hypothetical protein
MDTAVISGGKSGRDVALATDLHLMPRLEWVEISFNCVISECYLLGQLEHRDKILE